MADSTEQIIGVLFPLTGIEVTCEFGRQPENTTPAGANVRAYEVITERGRGGSRCGLSRWINQLVNGLSDPVQHLAVLVDPEDPGLNGPSSTIDPSNPQIGIYIPDISTNNTFQRNNFGGLPRYVPLHGAGRRPFKSNNPITNTITLTHNSIGDGVVNMDYQIDGGDIQFITVQAIVPGVNPAPGSNTGMFQAWLVPNLQPYTDAAQGDLTNNPKVVVTLTKQTDNTGATYYTPSFSVPPAMWITG